MQTGCRMRRASFILFIVAVLGVAAVWLVLSPRDANHGKELPVAATNFTGFHEANVANTNTTVGAESLDSLTARLKAAKANVESQAAQRIAKQMAETKAPEAEKKASTPTTEPQMSAKEFMAAFSEALSKGDAGAIQEVLRQAPRSAECVEALKGFLTAQGNSKDARRYAAEALMRIGTQESVGFVLDQALAA